MRQLNRLTARQISAIGKPGRYADGGNLILRVSDAGHKTYALLYMRDGRSRCMGLGPTEAVSLKLARELAAIGRDQLARGLDPIDERRRARSARAAESARLITFEAAAEQYMRDHEARWRNEQHRRDWRSSLRMHIVPVIGKLAVADVDLPAVMKCLQPLWNTMPQTGMRCRARIELVLDWCTARGYRSEPNPARWAGFLDKLLPPITALAPTKHQPSLPWQEMPGFMADLRQRQGVTARALEFIIMTAARVSEVTNMAWSEVDFARGVWTCPGERMKAGKDHEVPLPKRAIQILQAMPRTSERCFPVGRAVVRNLVALQMGLKGRASPHGFRASFRTWAGDTHAADPEVAERALAHAVKGQTAKAYDRTTLLKRRAALMQAWSDYLEAKPGKPKVVKLRG